jgi:hypothetical protein
MNMLNRGALCVAFATLFSAQALAAPKSRRPSLPPPRPRRLP